LNNLNRVGNCARSSDAASVGASRFVETPDARRYGDVVANGPGRSLQLRWDDDDEVWIGHFGSGGAAGTCVLTAIGLRVEFDRLDAGRVTRLTVSPGLDPEIQGLVLSLLGSAPEYPERASDVTRTVLLDPAVARALWDVVDLSEDARAAGAEGGTTAAVFTIELAAAAMRAAELLPKAFRDDVPDSHKLSVAVRALERLVQRRTPIALLAGLSGMLRDLIDAGAFQGTGDAEAVYTQLAVHAVLERIAEVLATSNEPEYCGNVSARVQVRNTCLEVAPPEDFERNASFIVRAWRDHKLVAVGQCTNTVTQLPVVSVYGVPIHPDLISRESPARAASVRQARIVAAEARRAERRADPHAGALWERAATWWLDARSLSRAAAALRRAASLADDPAERERYRQLASQVDPDGTNAPLVPERLWLWWSHWSRYTSPAEADAGDGDGLTGDQSRVDAEQGRYRFRPRSKGARRRPRSPSGRLTPTPATT
jgi:hypothetical protein